MATGGSLRVVLSGADHEALGSPVTVAGLQVDVAHREGCACCGGVASGTAIVWDGGSIAATFVQAGTTTYAFPPPPAPPAYKDGQVWRCGQPCAGTCGGTCYHPTVVPHGDDHACCGRLRIKFMERQWEREARRKAEVG